MFLKDIRDNILTMSFTTLSSSMKTSLSEFSFSSWTLRSSFFIIIFFLFSIHCCWKSLFLYCVNLIEFIIRDVTGCHSLEFHSAIGNKESVENNIISHFWFYLPSPLKSPWPSVMQYISPKHFFGRSWLYVMAIYEYLGHVELFMLSMQFVPALVWILCSSIWTI